MKSTSTTNGELNYVIKDYPLAQEARFWGDTPKKKAQYERVKSGFFCIYICRQVRYKDLVSGHTRKYNFEIKLKTMGDAPIYTEFLLNSNFDYTEKKSHKKPVPNK